MMKWRERWIWIAWVVLGFSVFLSGFTSGNFDIMVVGVTQAFAATSVFLTSYIRSEHKVKKTLEVVSSIVALGIVIWGYAVTGSFILGVITLFIGAMLFVAFVLSYLLPTIRSKFKSLN